MCFKPYCHLPQLVSPLPNKKNLSPALIGRIFSRQNKFGSDDGLGKGREQNSVYPRFLLLPNCTHYHFLPDHENPELFDEWIKKNVEGQ